jgi:hypothetical protein
VAEQESRIGVENYGECANCVHEAMTLPELRQTEKISTAGVTGSASNVSGVPKAGACRFRMTLFWALLMRLADCVATCLDLRNPIQQAPVSISDASRDPRFWNRAGS